MRTTRLKKKMYKKMYRNALLWLFLVIIPISAMAISLGVMKIYDKSLAASAKTGASGTAAVIKPTTASTNYNFVIKPKKLYRLELGSYENFDKAQSYISRLKAKKLNGFIQKDSGYKVIYGIFDSRETAEKLGSLLTEKKIQYEIAEIDTQSFLLKYEAKDKNFIEVVGATDALLDKLFHEKSELSSMLAQNTANNYNNKLEQIKAYEDKMTQYMNYATDMQVSDNAGLFKEKFIRLLEDIQEYRIETESKNDYYQIQNSLLNQVQAFSRFLADQS